MLCSTWFEYVQMRCEMCCIGRSWFRHSLHRALLSMNFVQHENSWRLETKLPRFSSTYLRVQSSPWATANRRKKNQQKLHRDQAMSGRWQLYTRCRPVAPWAAFASPRSWQAANQGAQFYSKAFLNGFDSCCRI